MNKLYTTDLHSLSQSRVITEYGSLTSEAIVVQKLYSFLLVFHQVLVHHWGNLRGRRGGEAVTDSIAAKNEGKFVGL